MATPPLFYRSHSTLQQFDGDLSGVLSDVGDEESINEAGGAGASSGQLVSSQHIHTNLLLVALLDHLSVLYLKDETQSNQLYKALVQALVSANVLKGFGSLDEASSLRAQYKLAFSKLLQSAISTITPKAFPRATTLQDRVRLFFEPRSTVRPPLLGAGVHGIINFNTSRYRDDFRQIARVGYGAYGSVFKVENKLDSCHYAVKKISFEGSEPDLWLKIINEVKLLAQLSHKHVVRYHNAWIEYDSPTLRVSEEADQLGPPRLPAPRVPQALTYPSDEGTSGSGSSIVFAETPDSVPALVSHVGPSSGSGSGSDNSSGSSQGEVSLSSPSSDGVARQNGQLLRPVVVLHIQMELCSRTLKDWLKTRNDRLSNNHTDPYAVVDAETNLHLLRQILKGLAFIHSHDLMHRDIKPKNIFLTQSEVGSCCTAKVGDFGLARHLAKGDEPLTPRPGRTNEPTLGAELLTCGVGTTIYAAPEQLNGSTYTQKCDMYSLGLVIFEMYQPFVTEMERIDSLNNLRRNVLPEKFVTKWPQQADCIRDLLSEVTTQRPSATELLESGLFNSQDQKISYLRTQNDAFYQELMELKKLLKSRDADIRRKDAEITMLRRQLVSTESTQSDGNVTSKSTQTDGQGLS